MTNCREKDPNARCYYTVTYCRNWHSNKLSIRYAEKNKKVDLDQINLVKSFKSDCHLSWLKHIVRQSICRKDLKITYLMGKRTKYESNSVSRNFFDCNQNVGKSLQTSRAKPLLGWSNNSLISRNICKPLNFSMKSDLLLVKKNMLHSIFFHSFLLRGKIHYSKDEWRGFCDRHTWF